MNILDDYPEVSFIENMTIGDIQKYYMDAMQEKYRELTGEELMMAEADPVRLIAYADCLVLFQIAQYADRAGKMALLKYSYGNYLDNIGALKGVRRLAAGKAVTTLCFSLSAVRPGVTVIPQGTRVTSADGIYFSTLELLEIPSGSLSGEVNAECREAGIKGNGYAVGMLNVMVDPVAYVDSVENVTVTQGGSDMESDSSLAERIYLTPSSWSVAGPDDAYKYWVKTYDAAVNDVMVYSDTPGVVEIRFMLQNGEIPSETMINEMEDFLMDGEIRPLTDQVHVAAPSVHGYSIQMTYYINRSDIQKVSIIQGRVDKAVQDYVDWQCASIGRDIIPDKLVKLVMAAGAKRIELESPSYVALTWEEIAILEGVPQITYGGIEDD